MPESELSPSTAVKTPDSARVLRGTYKRLYAKYHIDSQTIILVRGDEKLAAENKLLRKENNGLRGAIFEEKRKRKRKKPLNFYEEGEQEEQTLFFK